MSDRMIPIKTLLDDHQSAHSNLQMDYFITARSGGTPYGMYKQALRELASRYGTLQGLYLDREAASLDMEGCKGRFAVTARKRRLRAIERQKLQLTIDGLDHKIAETEREMTRFQLQATLLKRQVGDLTPDKRETMDQDMWAYKMKCMAATDYMITGRLGKGVIELLQCVPTEFRKQIAAEVLGGPETAQALTEWYLDYEHETKMLPEGTDNDA